jgi:hypothetical protein
LGLSEYQYYEFLAVDRPLDESDRQALRTLSTRARITATQFVNSYEWGDFKGNPAKLMERWFDLHLYFANWGTRRLMLRLPKRFVDLPGLGCFLDEVDGVTIRSVGDNLVFDILSEDEDPEEDAWDNDEWDDGSSRLAALAPLRAELIGGDLRFFYLLWLRALEAGALEDDASEPLPGIGPLTASLQAFADFVRIDPDLVRAASESEAADLAGRSARSVEAAIARLPDDEKNALLVRLFNADPYAGAELQFLLRRHLQPDEAASRPPPRTVGALRARAEALRLDRARAKAQAAAEHARRQSEEAEKRRRVRLSSLGSGLID